VNIRPDKEKQKENWLERPVSQAKKHYGANDAALPLLIREAMLPAIEARGLGPTLDLEFEVLPLVARSIYDGSGFGYDEWKALLAHADGVVDRAEPKLHELAAAGGVGLDTPVNWRSHDQVLLAFRQLGVNVANTQAETLKALKDPPEIVGVYLEFVKADKLASTYGERWLKLYNEHTKRIHPGWQQDGTATGRMSCHEPNVQNIPKDNTAYRSCLRPEPESGELVVDLDFSQIELRALAQLSGDAKMIEIFHKTGLEGDIHAQTASRIFKVSLAEAAATDWMRSAGKTTNFQIAYGAGPAGIQRRINELPGMNISLEEAVEYLQAFFDQYQGVRDWVNEQKQKIRSGGRTTSSLMGRLRTWREGDGPTDTEAVNSPVQSTAADGFKHVLALLWQRRNDPALEGFKLTLLEHDELVWEGPKEKITQALPVIQQCMEQGMSKVITAVPIVVGAKVKTSFGGGALPEYKEFIKCLGMEG
jgi:DNA polymerase-1